MCTTTIDDVDLIVLLHLITTQRACCMLSHESSGCANDFALTGTIEVIDVIDVCD